MLWFLWKRIHMKKMVLNDEKVAETDHIHNNQINNIVTHPHTCVYIWSGQTVCVQGRWNLSSCSLLFSYSCYCRYSKWEANSIWWSFVQTKPSTCSTSFFATGQLASHICMSASQCAPPPHTCRKSWGCWTLNLPGKVVGDVNPKIFQQRATSTPAVSM